MRAAKSWAIVLLGGALASAALAAAPGCRAVRDDYEREGGAPGDGAPAESPIAGASVATFAGGASAGDADGVGPAASFAAPAGLALDASGALLVVERGGGRVRRVGADGATSVVAGGLAAPFAIAVVGEVIYVATDRDAGGALGPATGAIRRLDGGAPALVRGGLGRPRGLAALADGRLVVADRAANTISVLEPASGALSVLAGAADAGFADGAGDRARFSAPGGVAVLPDQSILVADSRNHRVRRVTLEGLVGTFAGDGERGMLDTDRQAARFAEPIAVAADAIGNVYVSDAGNQRVRRIDASGAVQTLAGDGVAGFADGDGPAARFFAQSALQLTSDGAALFVSDGDRGEGDAPQDGPYHRVRRIALPEGL